MNTIQYMTGLLTFYLKGEISTDENFVKLKVPNTILALIPLGSQNHTIAVNQLASVASSFSLNFKRLIVGFLLACFSLSAFSDSFILGLILLLWGISTILTSFATELLISSTAGDSYYVSFLIFEKAKAVQAEQLINNMIASRLNDTNVRQVSEVSTNAIVDAIENK
ncbi:hypothetical protein CSX00_09940 [Pseudobutyrivibrio ruminis]|uniref:Uncharacterized protein n=1 Tax=Pseudobutyrivibrio ruminis TaxID=46206 RepID=A0A2G3E8Y5_9FIRM|nr:hypothetical protein [Pseudobutyrivibrio ruminis]PHU39625.1 hypothetical protein CSX00_09940 [Pseudobutyrivibrio ruminis]